MPATPAICISNLTVDLGGRRILDGVSLEVARGEMIGLVGASGAGKTVLLRTMLGLLPKSGGQVEILGQTLEHASRLEVRAIGQRCAAMFQHGALLPQRARECRISDARISPRLGPAIPLRRAREATHGRHYRADAEKMPSELSGGMVKRAALARALALDPEIVFLDEPTSGLDPIAAGDFDALIRDLHAMLGLTLFMIAHDLETLNAVCDRVAAIYGGSIVADGPLHSVLQSDHPWLQAYFRGERGRALQRAR